MMTVDTMTLTRDETGIDGTFGTLSFGEDVHQTCEPPWKDNRARLSCIPPGTYRIRLHQSPRFGRTALVVGTEPRTHILTHAGCVGGDTERGRHTHTLGCVLQGMRRGWLTVNGHRQRAVLVSRVAVRRFLDWLESVGGEADILVVDHTGGANDV